MTKFEELVRRGKLEIYCAGGVFFIQHLVQKDGGSHAFYFTEDSDLVKALQRIWDKEEYLFQTV